MSNRVIIAVEWGRLRGRRALLEPGRVIRIGRLERADLVVPHDEQLSGLHFELSWDGATCHLRDLGSVKGTWLNGECVSEGEVAHQDWVRAGDTFFSVYFEDAVPPLVEDDESAEALSGMPADRRTEALAELRAAPLSLFAVLDASRDKRVLQLLRSATEESQSLYEGQEGEELSEGAPYLVGLPRGSRLLERLVEEGWGKGWGIYIASQRPFAEVKRHLRRLLVVEEKGTDQLFYFRFYEPRALPKLIPTCTPRQRQQIFGEVIAFVMEGEAGALIRLDSAAPR